MPGKRSTSRNAQCSVTLHKPSSEGKGSLDLTPQRTEMEPTLLPSHHLLHTPRSTDAGLAHLLARWVLCNQTTVRAPGALPVGVPEPCWYQGINQMNEQV